MMDRPYAFVYKVHNVYVNTYKSVKKQRPKIFYIRKQ